MNIAQLQSVSLVSNIIKNPEISIDGDVIDDNKLVIGSVIKNNLNKKMNTSDLSNYLSVVSEIPPQNVQMSNPDVVYFVIDN